MRILCFGDSNTYGYDPRNGGMDRYPPDIRWVDLLARFRSWRCINRGQNGRQIPHTSRELEEAQRIFAANAQADLVIIMLGTNDLLQGLNAQQAGHRMAVFLQAIRPLCEKILVVSPPPLCLGEWVTADALVAESQALGKFLQDAARQTGTGFADTAPWELPIAFDGVHLTEEGHIRLAQMLWQILQ